MSGSLAFSASSTVSIVKSLRFFAAAAVWKLGAAISMRVVLDVSFDIEAVAGAQ